MYQFSEMEVPIRYLLNILHLTLVVQFKIIDFYKLNLTDKFIGLILNAQFI